MHPPPRPQGKVLDLGEGRFLPCLVWRRQRAPLGCHATREAAECAYDLGKLLVSSATEQAGLRAAAAPAPPVRRRSAVRLPCKAVAMRAANAWLPSRSRVQLVRKLGGDAAKLESLKLHRPLAAYTSHPLWPQLSGPHCSFEEACSLLAGGLTADFLDPQGHSTRASTRASEQRQIAWLEANPATAAAAAAAKGVDGTQDGSDTAGSSRGSDTDTGSAAHAARCIAGWQGLGPDDSGTVYLRLSTSLANGSGNTSIPGGAARAVQVTALPLAHAKGRQQTNQAFFSPLNPMLPATAARYLEAIAGTAQLSSTLTVTTPDGRHVVGWLD